MRPYKKTYKPKNMSKDSHPTVNKTDIPIAKIEKDAPNTPTDFNEDISIMDSSSNRLQDPQSNILRPNTLEDFLGQEEIKERLQITISAAKSRKESLPHQLFAGPPGLGKTTLATILAQEMGTEIKITSGPSLEKPGDLAGTLVGLEAGDILFIDEIHRLSPVIEEFLYPAMEDRKLDILVDSDQGTRSIRIDLKPFTLIGATTKPGSLSSPLRSRFQTIHRLELYNIEEIKKIVLRSAEKLDLSLHPEGATEIALRSRGTPRTSNNHLLWARDFAIAKFNTAVIDKELVLKALETITIDSGGLDKTDRKILETLCKNFQGGPVGLSSLSVACGEDPIAIEEMHEPYLIAQGYLKRTAQGRIALNKTREMFGLNPIVNERTDGDDRNSFPPEQISPQLTMSFKK
jgi:Holliday junction DNA helicase RuvB